MATELARIEPIQPLDRNPAAVYLSGLSKTGRRTMLCKLDRAAEVLGYTDAIAVPWAELRFQHVSAVRTRLHECGLAPATVNCTLAALKGVARAAFNLGLISVEEHQRIRDVKDLRYERELTGRALTDEEVRALFRVCAKDERAQGQRDAAMLALLLATGLRRSELVGITLDDYHQEGGELLVRGKGDKERTVYLSGRPKATLDAWLAVRGAEPGALFVPIDQLGAIAPGLGPFTPEALYNTLRLRARKAKVKRFSPHDLRRTFISNLLAAGGDLSVVSRFVGHASVRTTARYDRRGEDAKRALADLVALPSAEGGVSLAV